MMPTRHVEEIGEVGAQDPPATRVQLVPSSRVHEQKTRLVCLDRRIDAFSSELLGHSAQDRAPFNNVLTAILGYADLMDMELSQNSAGRSDLEEIRGAATRAADLVEQVLSFGKQRTGGARPLDLADTRGGLEGILSRIIGPGIAVRIESQPDLGRVLLDPSRFEQALLNLCTNARDAIAARETAEGRIDFGLDAVTIDVASPSFPGSGRTATSA